MEKQSFLDHIKVGLETLKGWFFNYLYANPATPAQNRERVGKNLTLLSIFLFFIFLINFVVIIVTDTKFGVDLSENAQATYKKEVTVQAKRGTIYDRDGNPIAEDSTTYSIYAILSETYVSAKQEKLYIQESQFDKVAEILNTFLGIDPETTKTQLKQKGLYQVSFGIKGNEISYSTRVAIEKAAEDAGITGLGFTTSPGRLYPNGAFASHLIGYADLVNNDDGTQSLAGVLGIEASLDASLAGQDGKILYQKDASGNIVPGTGVTETQAVDGKDVYTTISTPMQTYLESAMDNFNSIYEGQQVNATLVAAKTGEIIATTQRPTYFPEDPTANPDINQMSLLYQGNYEPGSTMKVFTLASAIDSGVFTTEEYYYNDELTIVDTTIRDWSVNAGQEPVTLNFAQGFAFSSNIGMTMLEQKMGNALWLNYISKFKFGFPTRFGLGNEDGGTVSDDNEVTIAMSSFGQGIAATQIQMLRGFTAIANNGVMLEPKFLSGTYDPNTDSARVSQVEVIGNPVSADAAALTRQYMITVGTDPQFGTLYSNKEGAIIKVSGYNVAVKSGTAEIAATLEQGGGYLTGERDYINSVVAMVPAEDPEFIMYVTIQQPLLKNFEGTDWKYIFNPVLEEAMMMKDALNLTSPTTILSNVETETAYKMPDFIGQGPGTVSTELRRNYVHPIVLGTGSVLKKMSIKVGSKVAANQQILLLSDNFTALPDMYGWTKENVEIFAKWTGITVKFKGSDTGTVIQQSKDTNTPLSEMTKLTITLGE